MAMEFLISLIDSYGYVGVFLASLIGNASVIFPLPSFLFVAAAGAILDPLIVGILAGIGAAIGEITGYIIGAGGNKVALYRKKAWKRHFEQAERWFQEKKGFVIIFIFAVTPLPTDIIGIFSGIIRYDIKKFFLAMLIGKIILNTAFAYAGFYGIEFLSGYSETSK